MLLELVPFKIPIKKLTTEKENFLLPRFEQRSPRMKKGLSQLSIAILGILFFGQMIFQL
jgi:hypothetical protein